MGHWDLELWERYLLYPRILDVLQALTGPDVLAMQTMLFTKGTEFQRPGLPPRRLLYSDLSRFADRGLDCDRSSGHGERMLVDVAGQPSRADLSPSHGYGMETSGCPTFQSLRTSVATAIQTTIRRTP